MRPLDSRLCGPVSMGVSAERLAIQRSGRRQAGTLILRRCLCGDQIRLQRHYEFDSLVATIPTPAHRHSQPPIMKPMPTRITLDPSFPFCFTNDGRDADGPMPKKK